MKKLLWTTALITTAFMATAQAQGMSKAEIEAIVKDYIENNPEVILDSVEAYGREQQDVSDAERQAAIQEHLGWLEENDNLPVAGNPDGDVTIVEFFDYNCGYCKKAVTDVTTIIEEDKNVKFVFVEMPILGRTSEVAARWAMAAQKQDAYMEFHINAMQNRGPITEESLTEIASKMGLDIEKMRVDAQSDDVTAMISEKAEKASQMGITGTPAFIINGKLYGGYIGVDAMRTAIKEARAS